MNPFAKSASSLTCLMVLLTACGADTSNSGSDATHAAGTVVDPAWLAQKLEGDEGVPGEDAQEQDKGNGRVYIEWCDRPNNNAGTICRTYDGTLQWPADRDECRRDTSTVCGGATADWILCAGQPCYWM